MAALAVRRAEHGPAAVRRLRGERVSAFFRPRPGLAVLLYLAAAQGRVVWRWPAGFALLEPPGGGTGWVGTGRRARIARRVEAAWPYARDHLPAILLLAAIPFALFAGRYAELLASLAVLLMTLYLGCLQLPAVVRALYWFVQWLRGARRRSRATANRVLDRNWSVGLCHLDDPAEADALLRECLRRATDLAAGTRQAGGMLVCQAAAVTTEPARVAVATARAATGVPDVDEAMVLVRNPGKVQRAPVPVRMPAFLGVFFVCSLIAFAVLAWIIVDQGTTTAGWGTAYVDALVWLLDQTWVFGDWGTTVPASPPARLYGVIAQLFGVVALGVLARAGWESYRAQRTADEAGEQAVERVVADADVGLVFVNYRGGVHRHLVTVLRRELAGKLGEGKVFMDYWSMPPGVRYPDALRAGVRRCRVLLAVIHDGWLEDLRTPRDGPDWVHDEIAAALEFGKVVIGVYFDGAPRLRAEDLPPAIRDLALRQDCRIRWQDGNLDDDLDRLARAVLAAVRRHDDPRLEPGPAGRQGT